jgi:ferrochelatase
MSFQSRLGVAEWMREYTDETLKSLPGKGIKNVQVICPGFSADCLETIEEINEENKEYFMQSGGEKFGYIPALNDSSDHIEFLTQLLIDNTSGWIK